MVLHVASDSVHWYINSLTSRIVAASGNPEDRFHLGKMIFQSLMDAPDFTMQIDGATGESVINETILKRSVQCAICFENIGLRSGDAIVLAAPNHVDLAVPVYAALYLGLIVAPVDRTMCINELKETLDTIQPKLIFCQSEQAKDMEATSKDYNTQIITFDKGSKVDLTMFINNHKDDSRIPSFKPHDFDGEDTIAFLIPTSGTTGLPKFCASTHKNVAIASPYWLATHVTFPTPTRLFLLISPLQWMSAIICFTFSPILRFTRLQTSAATTNEHMYNLINTYKPTLTVMSPPFITNLVKSKKRDTCDFSCFDFIIIGGSAVPLELLQELKKLIPHANSINCYGMTEINGLAFISDGSAQKSSGKPAGHLQFRLVDVDTNEVIDEPNRKGELQVKGPSIFKGYYRNPAATKETFSDDGWFKTGDLFYRDDNWNYFFVERIKLLLKYKSAHISPLEIENVIRQHPEVQDVAVTGLRDSLNNEMPVAWVVRKSKKLGAQEIKDHVKSSLSDPKQLRGGVVFLDQLPLTATSKVHRKKLNEMVHQAKRE